MRADALGQRIAGLEAAASGLQVARPQANAFGEDARVRGNGAAYYAHSARANFCESGAAGTICSDFRHTSSPCAHAARRTEGRWLAVGGSGHRGHRRHGFRCAVYGAGGGDASGLEIGAVRNAGWLAVDKGVGRGCRWACEITCGICFVFRCAHE